MKYLGERSVFSRADTPYARPTQGVTISDSCLMGQRVHDPCVTVARERRVWIAPCRTHLKRTSFLVSEAVRLYGVAHIASLSETRRRFLRQSRLSDTWVASTPSFRCRGYGCGAPTRNRFLPCVFLQVNRRILTQFVSQQTCCLAGPSHFDRTSPFLSTPAPSQMFRMVAWGELAVLEHRAAPIAEATFPKISRHASRGALYAIHDVVHCLCCVADHLRECETRP